MYSLTIVLAAVCVVAVRGHSNCVGCHTGKCGENEVAVAGHARRDRFCRPAYTPHQLFIERRKCICKPRYVRNSWNECVPRKLCRRCKCRLQKDWHMCSSACPVTYNMTVPFCSKMCVPGCDCPPGWVVDSRNWKRCVKAVKYPPICPPHSNFEACVSSCSPRCGIIAPKTCVTSCHRGACVCDKGFAEFWGYDGRRCVRQEKCEWFLRNFFSRNGRILDGGVVGLAGGAIRPGGLVMGPGGPPARGTIGLPVGAGIFAGGASLIGTGGAAGTGVRVPGGGSGTSSAGSGMVGVGSHGGGVNLPAGTLSSGTDVSTYGASGNNRDVIGANSMGASLGGTAGVGGGGLNVGGGSTPFSISRGISGGTFGTSTLGIHATNIGVTLPSGAVATGGGGGGGGVSVGGGSTPISISRGTIGGTFGSSTLGVHAPGIRVAQPSGAVTTAAGTSLSNAAGTRTGVVAVGPSGTSLSGGMEVGGAGVHGERVTSLTTASGAGSLENSATGVAAAGGRLNYPAGAASSIFGPSSSVTTGGSLVGVGADTERAGLNSTVGLAGVSSGTRGGGASTAGATGLGSHVTTSGAGGTASGIRGVHLPGSSSTSLETRHPNHSDGSGATGSEVSHSSSSRGSGVLGGGVHVGNGHSVTTTSAVGGFMNGAGTTFTHGNTGSHSSGSPIEGPQPSGPTGYGGNYHDGSRIPTTGETTGVGRIGLGMGGTNAHSTIAAGSAISGATSNTGGTSTTDMSWHRSSASGPLLAGTTASGPTIHGEGAAELTSEVSSSSNSGGLSGTGITIGTGGRATNVSLSSDTEHISVHPGSPHSHAGAGTGAATSETLSGVTSLHGTGGLRTNGAGVSTVSTSSDGGRGTEAIGVGVTGGLSSGSTTIAGISGSGGIGGSASNVGVIPGVVLNHSGVVPGGAAVALSPGSIRAGAATGTNTFSGSASAIGVGPAGPNFRPGTVPGGATMRLSPGAAAAGATAGINMVGGSSPNIPMVLGSRIPHPGAVSGGVAAGGTPGTMATGASAGISSVGETTATAGSGGMPVATATVPGPVALGIVPGPGGVTIATAGGLTGGSGVGASINGAGTTSLVSTGANAGGSDVGLSRWITLTSGNTAAVGAGSGGSYQPLYLVYGVPPPAMLTSGTLLSRGGASGPVVYRSFPDFSRTYPDGVDIGEAPPSSENHAHGEENANIERD